MKLDMAKFAAAPAGEASPSVAASGTASVTVDANAPNCDIEADGSFIDNTPSTLNLIAGKHDIVVKKTGYEIGLAALTVGSGLVHLNADVVAQ